MNTSNIELPASNQTVIQPLLKSYKQAHHTPSLLKTPSKGHHKGDEIPIPQGDSGGNRHSLRLIIGNSNKQQ